MQNPIQNRRIAIVCDWLTNMGGAEKVILSLHRLFPQAPIYTTLFDKKRVQGFEDATIFTSFLQKIPFAKKHHQLMLSFMPLAIESLNLNDYDIVISSSHSVAKGIITKPETIHICYCHTPMRYAWEPWEMEYRLQRFPKLFHNRIKKKLHEIRLWDRLTADRVDFFIANSKHVADRIKKYYRKNSTVIYPPVKTENFSIGIPKDYFLMVGRLIPYKRFDLVIDAFSNLGKQLLIVGEGPEKKKLKKLAKKNIRFLDRVDDQTLQKLYQECQALIFPQIEDFGLSAVECMASGRPVLAYGKGGVLETVIDGTTGLFFPEQSVGSITDAIRRFEHASFDPQAIKQHAEKFSEKRFWQEIVDFISMKNTIK